MSGCLGGWSIGGVLLNVLTFWGLTQGTSCYCLVRHQLPVLWIIPLSGEPGRGNITAEVLPAVQLALHHLSEQSPPLGNYELQFHLTDSEVTRLITIFSVILHWFVQKWRQNTIKMKTTIVLYSFFTRSIMTVIFVIIISSSHY